MVNTLIIFWAVTLLGGLLFFVKNRNLKGKLATKTILSCLFIFIALVQSHPIPGYFYILLIGLIFCLGGDVFLALPRERMFLFGLVSFLLGHVFYAGCFFTISGSFSWPFRLGLLIRCIGISTIKYAVITRKPIQLHSI